MSATREVILRTIRARGRVTVNELAQAASISTASVRHHLASLQAEGLITASEVRQGVGRPRLYYSLTVSGAERFAMTNLKLSERLLDELKATLPAEVIEKMFVHMAEGLVAEYAGRLEGKSLEEKLSLLVEILGAEGFLAEWKRAGERLALTEHNCPYLRLCQRHPEICTLGQTLISQVLQSEVEKTASVLDGNERCEFVVKP